MGKPRKQPLRMCLGCGEMKNKNELVRIVKNKEGEIFADLTSRAAGRGAYICRDAQCLSKAQKSRRLEKAFSCRISDEIYKTLEGEISDCAK